MSTGQADDTLAAYDDPTNAGAYAAYGPAWLPPVCTPLTADQTDLLHKFGEALYADQIHHFLTPNALCHLPPSGFEPQWGSLNCFPAPFLGPGPGPVWGMSTNPQTKARAKGKGQKQQNPQNAEEGETEEDKDEKKMDKEFYEGEVWFSSIHEWHQLQLAYSAGKRVGEAHGATETKWNAWVAKWRSLRHARNTIIVLRKELGTLDKTEKAELDKIDKQEKDGNDQNSSAQKNKVKSETESKRQALQKKIQAELTLIDDQKLLPQENEEEEREKRLEASSKTLWDLFKQQHPPSWEEVSRGEVEDEPEGTEWWKGRVLELSKNINVHMITQTKYQNNPYTVAIQEEIKSLTRGNQVKKRIFQELKGSVTDLVKHADAHHVLKEVLATGLQKQILFIKEEILAGKDKKEHCDEWHRLAKQRWGCRVLNQMLLRMEKAAILDIIKCLVDDDVDKLAKHKYGHWVIGQLVEEQRFWEGDDEKDASLVVEEGKELIRKLTASVKTLMTPDKQDKQDPAANNQPASTEGSKKSNTNADCNGAAVLDKAMKNTNIPADLSKLLCSSVLEEANHELLADMGCTRFGVEAAKRALGAYADEDGMDEDRVEPSKRAAALAYLAQDSVVCKLKLSRYGRVLNGFVQKQQGDEEGSDEGV